MRSLLSDTLCCCLCDCAVCADDKHNAGDTHSLHVTHGAVAHRCVGHRNSRASRAIGRDYCCPKHADLVVGCQEACICAQHTTQQTLWGPAAACVAGCSNTAGSTLHKTLPHVYVYLGCVWCPLYQHYVVSRRVCLVLFKPPQTTILLGCVFTVCPVVSLSRMLPRCAGLLRWGPKGAQRGQHSICSLSQAGEMMYSSVEAR